MIDEKFSWLALNNEPRLMIGYNRTSMVEFLNVESTSLSSKGSDSNLKGSNSIQQDDRYEQSPIWQDAEKKGEGGTS